LGLIAITREPSATLGKCELTHLERVPIDVDRARAQHDDYERRLQVLGCTMERLAPEPDLPDSVFVEDAAVVLDEVAVITRPGAASRRRETASVAEALERYRPLVKIESPATLDGGDVLVLGRNVYVGLTSRSGDKGLEQLRSALGCFGYSVGGVPVRGCLHLKSAVTRVAEDVILTNPAWVDPAGFEGWRTIEVDPAEPYGANGLAVGGAVVYAQAFPRTADRLRGGGIRLETVDVSELAKAEGAVTCCSLVFEEPGDRVRS
jgi:dimethylargininase